MDFSKLNLEFTNMQETVKKYNKMVLFIQVKIKDNERIIGKYKTKAKSLKNKLEKDLATFYIKTLEYENDLLNLILADDEVDKKQVEK